MHQEFVWPAVASAQPYLAKVMESPPARRPVPLGRLCGRPCARPGARLLEYGAVSLNYLAEVLVRVLQPAAVAIGELDFTFDDYMFYLGVAGLDANDPHFGVFHAKLPKTGPCTTVGRWKACRLPDDIQFSAVVMQPEGLRRPPAVPLVSRSPVCIVVVRDMAAGVMWTGMVGMARSGPSGTRSGLTGASSNPAGSSASPQTFSLDAMFCMTGAGSETSGLHGSMSAVALAIVHKLTALITAIVDNKDDGLGSDPDPCRDPFRDSVRAVFGALKVFVKPVKAAGSSGSSDPSPSLPADASTDTEVEPEEVVARRAARRARKLARAHARTLPRDQKRQRVGECVHE